MRERPIPTGRSERRAETRRKTKVIESSPKPRFSRRFLGPPIIVGGIAIAGAWALTHGQEQDQRGKPQHAIARQLQDWDTFINKKPNSFRDIEQELIVMVTNHNSSQLGFEPDAMIGRTQILNQPEYIAGINEASTCQSALLIPNEPGRTDPLSGKIFISRETHLYQNPTTLEPRSRVASLTFMTIVHEQTHADSILQMLEAPVPYQTSSGLVRIIAHSGFGLLFEDPKNNKGERICLGNAQINVEESHAYTVSRIVMEDIGIFPLVELPIPSFFGQLTQSYRDRIIRGVFNGDLRRIQALHRPSNDTGLFTAVGLKLEPTSLKPAEIGKTYVDKVTGYK